MRDGKNLRGVVEFVKVQHDSPIGEPALASAS